MTGGSKFEVSKFDGHGNFGLWQTRVKDLLAQQGIQKGLRAEKPKGMEDDDWQDLQERAAGTIRLCLADEVMYHVMHLKSADEIWKKLESQFMSKTLTTKLYLKQRLYGLKMQEGTDLGQHVNIFNQVVTDLASLEVKIEDEDKAMILLCSLPPSYEHMVTTLTYGKETIKTEEITSALLAHNQRKQKSGESSSQSDSLYVKGNQDRGRKQVRDNSGNRNFRSKSRDKSKGRKTVTCYKCKEQGHFKRDAQSGRNRLLICHPSLQMWYRMRNLIAVMEICYLFRLRTVLDKGESSSSAPDDVDHDVSGPTDVPESYKLARDRVRRTNIQAPIGYKRCDFDCCVYTKSLGDGSMIFLLLYVDDMLIAAKNMRDIIDLKRLLSQEFEMKDLGAAKKIHGMEIHRDRGSKKLWLSQKGYVEKVLQRFGMNEAKPVSTPLANHFKLSVDQCPKSDKETQDMVEIPYASVVGCLMYAMVCTRPDLAHAVGQVCKYMSRPGKQHWEAVKWIFRYLKGTAGHGIVFGDQRLDPLVVGYVDSDYAGDLDNRRSTTGLALRHLIYVDFVPFLMPWRWQIPIVPGIRKSDPSCSGALVVPGLRLSAVGKGVGSGLSWWLLSDDLRLVSRALWCWPSGCDGRCGCDSRQRGWERPFAWVSCGGSGCATVGLRTRLHVPCFRSIRRWWPLGFDRQWMWR
ncbi:Uncharacterized mitochondrial protein AtMg00810 [Striga hermonthica]|uniref:Uncharacterized mitochondrial protein AtMg00810 n=1 Tax=Striga hermonthica TaxID=68872 RepID=A0A9N7R8I4_STRHE|nr:Uncharacterized mitochondrial protein AtMg00810 [Striga hermonthica]